MTKKAIYLSNLTALRGIAALLTVVYHVGMWLGVGGGMLAKLDQTKLIEKLYLMVDFFFVLSGFIMCYVYGKDFADSVTGAKFRRFIGARFARVYPLHVLTLCLMALTFWVSAKVGLPDLPALTTENSIYSFVTNLFLLHSMNLHGWFTWVHASWSISTEWWMYMIFPFLAAPFFRLSKLSQ
jgi:peptidoglycan/LPS O-acetylase OafA/YrhL